MAGKILQQIVSGQPLPRMDGAANGTQGPEEEDSPRIARTTIFQEDTEPPLRMADIEAALVAKRAEQKEKLKRLATLAQEMCDILNTFDA